MEGNGNRGTVRACAKISSEINASQESAPFNSYLNIISRDMSRFSSKQKAINSYLLEEF